MYSITGGGSQNFKVTFKGSVMPLDSSTAPLLV
jgi:hypothetical protein